MDHENSHILKKAIDEMPARIAPARVWAGIQSEIVQEQNRAALEKAILDFKGPVASPVSWEELALRMVDDQPARQHARNAGIKIFSLSKSAYWLSGIAASLILAVCIGVYITRQANEAHGDLAGTIPVLSPEATEEEALKFIERFCSGENITCTSAAFLELKAELDESTEELKEISKQLSVFRDDPGLLQAKSTVEKYRAAVLKEITLMI